MISINSNTRQFNIPGADLTFGVTGDSGTEVKNFTITATVDTKPYNVGVTMTEAFTPGKVYKINVKITNVGLVIDSVVIVDEWQEDNTLPEGELKPPGP